MLKGIDVSENNGIVNWDTVKKAGMEFAVIRLGYGRGHLDSEFYNNVNGAVAAGLKIGVFHVGNQNHVKKAVHNVLVNV